MAPRIINGSSELKTLVGEHLGYSEWTEITQGQVNLFAEATGDHQWIHVDPERAIKESPFGGPIAHGYLTLSLGPVLLPQVAITTGFKMGVNYGMQQGEVHVAGSGRSQTPSRREAAGRRRHPRGPADHL